jgi:hypothetical protein
LYRPSEDPSGKSPIDQEVRDLGVARTVGLAVLRFLQAGDLRIWLIRYQDQGRVHCVGGHYDGASVYAFHATRNGRIVVLYVTAGPAAGPPVEGYAIAECRLQDILV